MPNALISEFQGLIRQAIGGECELKLRTDEKLWQCLVDPPLLETALLNLALNGRDAMPDGGILEIETQNVVLDERNRAGVRPARMSGCRSRTPAAGWRPKYGIGSSSPSSRPRKSARAPASASAWSMASSGNPEAMSPIESATGSRDHDRLYLPKASNRA